MEPTRFDSLSRAWSAGSRRGALRLLGRPRTSTRQFVSREELKLLLQMEPAEADVTVSEPGALLAFTGPRVVQQTTREKLPDDFGLAESNARFGHVDAIIPGSPR